MAGDKDVLVYFYRGNGKLLGPKNIAKITEKELVDILERHRNLQETRKTLGPRALHPTIRQRDLLTPTQLAEFESKRWPNLEANMASVTIPMKYWRQFDELIILSKQSGIREYEGT